MRSLIAGIVLMTCVSAQGAEPGYLDSFILDRTPLFMAFEAWSAQTQVPVIANWERLEEAGVEVDRPVSIALENVKAGTVLKLLLNWAAADGLVTLVLEVQPGYIEVLTREEALRRPIIRVYDVRDLLMEIPHFDNAPSFSLTDALSNTNSGGGGSSSGGLFDDDDSSERPRRLTRAERGEQLAELIRESIEPDIWQAHGGEHASVIYFDGRLVVKAPQYVHGVVRRIY